MNYNSRMLAQRDRNRTSNPARLAGFSSSRTAGLDQAKKNSFLKLKKKLRIYSLAPDSGVLYLLGCVIFINAKVGNIRE